MRFRVDIVPKTNDGWLNCHNLSMLKVWRANHDFQLVIDASKLKIYMTKYVTKAEEGIKGSVAHFMKHIIKKAMSDGAPTQTIIRRIMSRLLGERTMCLPECCHLMNSMALYHCSHRYVKHVMFFCDLILSHSLLLS